MKKLGVFAVVASHCCCSRSTGSRIRFPEPAIVPLTAGPPQPRIAGNRGGHRSGRARPGRGLCRRTQHPGADRGAQRTHRVREILGRDHVRHAGEALGFHARAVAITAGSAMNDRLVPGIDTPLSGYVPGFEEGSNSKKTLRGLLTPEDINSGMGARVREHAGRSDRAGDGAELRNHRCRAHSGNRWRRGASRSRGVAPRKGRARFARVAACGALGDWMRLGELLANDGVFEANQLTPPRFVTTDAHAHAQGFAAWIFHACGRRFRGARCRVARVAGTQRLWMVPSLELVILRMGGDPPAKGWDEAMIPDSIIRGTSGWQPRRRA